MVRFFFSLFLLGYIPLLNAQQETGVFFPVTSPAEKHLIGTTSEGNLISLFSDVAGTLNLNILNQDKKVVARAEITPDFKFIPLTLIGDNEGGVFIGGKAVIKPENKQDGVILKCDRDGNILATEILGGDGNDEITNLYFTEEHKLLFCGNSENGPRGKDAWVGESDSNLAIVWQSRLGWQAEESANQLIQRKNRSILVVGSTLSKGAGLRDMLLLNINNQGDLMWGRVYGKHEASEEALSITELADSSLLLTGISLNGDTDGLIYRTNPEGSVLWSLKIGDAQNQKLLSAYYTPSSLLFCGNAENKKNGKMSGWQVETSLEGKILKEETGDDNLLYMGLAERLVYGTRIEDGTPFFADFTQSGNLANLLSEAKMSVDIAVASPPKTNVKEEVRPPPPNIDVQDTLTENLPESAPLQRDSLHQKEWQESPDSISVHPKTTEEFIHDPFLDKKLEIQGTKTTENGTTERRPTENPIETPKGTVIISDTEIAKNGKMFFFAYGIPNSDSTSIIGADLQKVTDYFTTHNRLAFNSVYSDILEGGQANSQNLKKALLHFNEKIRDDDLFMLYFRSEILNTHSGEPSLSSSEENSRNLTMEAIAKSLMIIQGEKIVVFDLYCPKKEIQERYLIELTKAFEFSEKTTVIVMLQTQEAVEHQTEYKIQVVPETILKATSKLADSNDDGLIILSEFCDYMENNLKGTIRQWLLPALIIKSQTDFPFVYPND